ncbi:hypothetical protein DICPUDRAFT_156902 [Dictyostelium purpureum]|uniref:Wntless-like transmembrane domain-containing protein n=1 Tax=Dictyostelium purpureum TaxID=5786 RepID=F0ZXR0_DICPU|nr:uncharacterized protein DICPUDRAFT_156902 [Dictyostelium purpureum]EGC31269.1 hypothetical protein DICPUDRAFT_156902 [Dictyostelium purpureum]|eukprot:XP_003292214.1 hypothetical protein DICPUDRAFT_156902 [Dictyostelium purpureum]
MVSTTADIGSDSAGLLTNVDISSIRRLFIVGGICVVALLIAIIVGSTGPKVYDSDSYNLYQCENGTHIWSDSSCVGLQNLTNGNIWSREMPEVSTLNRFWSLEITPFSNNLTQFTAENVTFLVTIKALGSILLKSENTSQIILCDPGYGPCNTLTIIDEEVLDYVLYTVQISIVSESTAIGDINFTAWRAHDSFSSFEIGVHLTLVIISCIGIVGFLVAMRTYSLIKWTFEQKYLFAIFFVLLLSNNPLYGLQYATQGWFFPFCNALFSIIFLSIFSLYSLMVLDRLRTDTKETEWTFSTISKVVLVGIFTILGIALFSWINIRDRKDPIIGPATSQNGIQILFYLVATIFICILLWILLLVITSFPVAYAKKYNFAKFLFISIPILVYVFSILFGIFAGTFGPLNPTSLSVTYFNVLNNVFTAILAYSYWPSANPFHKQREQDDETSLLYNEEI